MTDQSKESDTIEDAAGMAHCRSCAQEFWKPESVIDRCSTCGSFDWVLLPTDRAAVRAAVDEIQRQAWARTDKLSAAGWPDVPEVRVVPS